MIKAYLVSLRPRLSGRWRTNEIHATIGGKRMYLRAHRRREPVLDSSLGGPAKNTADMRPLMRGPAACRPQPRGAHVRRRPRHSKACNDAYPVPGLRRKTHHERHIHLAGDRNNKMESFNGGVRAREKS